MINFPSLPKYSAQWRALYFESIPGSGEKFTFAIIAKGNDGRTDIRDTLRPGALRTLFGEQGEVMHGLMIRSIVAIKKKLENGGNWESTQFMLSNIQAGPIRETLADNFEQVFDQAIRLSASLGYSSIGTTESVISNLDEDLLSWSGRIKSFVEVMKSELSDNFNRNIKERNSRAIKARIGFMYGDYAASFGVIHTRSDRISGDITSIKKKLWDLDQLRHDDILPPKDIEIIVGHAPLELINLHPRMAETLRYKLETLSQEASHKNISVFKASDVRIAAEHIIKKVSNA